jgi:hypothetical protein
VVSVGVVREQGYEGQGRFNTVRVAWDVKGRFRGATEQFASRDEAPTGPYPADDLARVCCFNADKGPRVTRWTPQVP